MQYDFNPFCTLYMPTWVHSLYLFNPNTKEICTVYQKSAKKYRYEFLLILPSPTLKKRAFGHILARCVSVASREKPFSQTEFMTTNDDLYT